MAKQSTPSSWIRWLDDSPERGQVADWTGTAVANLELLLFELGHKPAVKVEDQGLAEVARLRAMANREGAFIDVVERDSGPTAEARDMHSGEGARSFQVFLSNTASAIPLLIEMERRERRGGTQRLKAIARSGEILGYPACCVRSFATLPRQDDAALVEAYREQSGDFPECHPIFNIFPPMVSPVTWYPCSLSCANTAAQADASLAVLQKHGGHHAERVSRLQGVTIVFSRFLFAHLHDAHRRDDWIDYGEVSDALSWTTDPLFVEAEPLSSFRREVTELLGGGCALKISDGRIVVRPRDGTEARRGELLDLPLLIHFKKG